MGKRLALNFKRFVQLRHGDFCAWLELAERVGEGQARVFLAVDNEDFLMSPVRLFT